MRAKSSHALNGRTGEHAAYPVVAIGTGEGGLEPFSDLLAHLPPNPGFAVILVQDLKGKPPRNLAEVLRRTTPMPVVDAQPDLTVDADCVYVLPPSVLMGLSGGALRLIRRPSGTQAQPIDRFFRSVAEDRHRHAIGILLSGASPNGSASDGTGGILGLQAIRAEGGVALAQRAPALAGEIPGRPLAAFVDSVLSPEHMGPELVRLSQHPYLAEDLTGGGVLDGADMEALQRELKSSTGVDTSVLRPDFVASRVLRRMAVQGLRDFSEYAAHLRGNAIEPQALVDELVSRPSGFFEDPAAFELLETKVLPRLLARQPAGAPLRVWVPGCSNGEEAYTVAIQLLEFLERAKTPAQLHIFATDANRRAIEQARAGVYPEGIASQVGAERLSRFFERAAHTYHVKASVREICFFGHQNLAQDAPLAKMDLVVCRNLLRILGPALEHRIGPVFHFALKPGGVLVLGSSDEIPNPQLFAPIHGRHRIFERTAAAPASLHEGQQPSVQGAPSGRAEPSLAAVRQRVHEIVLGRFSPPGMVVDENLRVLLMLGKASQFLEHPTGDADLTLPRMSRGSLSAAVRRLIDRARAREAPARSQEILMLGDRSLQRVQVSATPLRVSDLRQAVYLVLFERPADDSLPQGTQRHGRPGGGTARRLERQLALTRQELEAMLAEQEANVENLTMANEEIGAANEELTAANRQLVAGREELHSVMQEAATLGEEMQRREADLTRITQDLRHLLRGIPIPFLVLGKDLSIRYASAELQEVFHLRPTDVGRSVAEVAPKFDLPNFEQLVRSAIQDGIGPERVFIRNGERSFRVDIRPDQDEEGGESVVVTFIPTADRTTKP